MSLQNEEQWRRNNYTNHPVPIGSALCPHFDPNSNVELFEQCCEIRQVFDSGTTATGYLVYHRHENKLVVVKRSNVSFANAFDRERQQHEVQIYNLLNQGRIPPGWIPKFYRAWEQKGFLHLMIEYMGKTSLDFVNNLDNMIEYFSNMAENVAALNDLRICHRDIKPANVVKNEVIRRLALIDFGNAIVTEDPRQYKFDIKSIGRTFMEVILGGFYNPMVEYESLILNQSYLQGQIPRELRKIIFWCLSENVEGKNAYTLRNIMRRRIPYENVANIGCVHPDQCYPYRSHFCGDWKHREIFLTMGSEGDRNALSSRVKLSVNRVSNIFLEMCRSFWTQ